MEIEVISAILGSAVVSTFISSLFSHFINRKNNALQHITEERRTWREKIRKISEDIEKVKFGDKKIDQLLVKLEVNINSYGKALEDDYEKDSHIWREIEELKRIDKKKEFNVHKELLIYYLSLMLKEDWERSKQEVKGYSRTLIEVIIIPIINCIIGVCYSYKLDNEFEGLIDMLINIIIVTLIIYVFLRYLLGNGTWKIVDKNRIKKSYSYKLAISYVLLTLLMSITSMFLFGLLEVFYPQFLLLNLFLWAICVGEFIVVYLDWTDIILKKARLAATVINVQHEFLGEVQLEQYENDIKELYKYMVNKNMCSAEIKSAHKIFKKLKVEYITELNNRKKMLKKGRTDLKKIKEYNQMHKKIQELNEIADNVKNFTKKAQIYKQKT